MSTTLTNFFLVLSDARVVYQAKGVSAIPLEEARAAAIVKMLSAAKASTKARSQGRHDPSRPTAKTPPPVDTDSAPHVKFLSVREKDNADSSLTDEGDDDMTSDDDSSDVSDDTPPGSPSPISRALAAQLSFWAKVRKQIDEKTKKSPPPSQSSALSPGPVLDSPSMEDVGRRLSNGENSADILKSIIAKSAPPPSTTEAKYSELENKIVRETIKMFVRGGMYFSYTFGIGSYQSKTVSPADLCLHHVDITTPLQRKYQQVQKLKRQSSLLKDLEAYEQSPDPQLLGDDMEVLSEPHPTLPLWRRVDRRFWWNEILSKPLVDAGV